jgi:hypothetical protein
MTTRLVGQRRLFVLADFLDTVPEKDFDFSIWADTQEKHLTPGCGTAACAMGWATAIPSFRRAGLHLENDKTDCMTVPVFRGERGVFAAIGMFGLTRPEARYLFTACGSNNLTHDATPKKVAAHIRRFAKQMLNKVMPDEDI